MITDIIFYWKTKFSSSTLLGKIFRYPLKLIPKTLPIPILSGTAKGFKWIAGSTNDSGPWIGIYELNIQKALNNLLKEGDVFYDIGANVGFFTILGSKLVGNRGKVIAFEPLQVNFSFLLRHIKINYLSNVSIIEKAVSSKNNIQKMTVPLVDNNAAYSMAEFCSNGDIKVDTVTVDNLVFDSKYSPPNIIKMDIEGAEFLALCGMEKTIEKYKPTILLSTHGEKVDKQCRKFLGDRGYKITLLSAGKITREDELLCVYQN